MWKLDTARQMGGDSQSVGFLKSRSRSHEFIVINKEGCDHCEGSQNVEK